MLYAEYIKKAKEITIVYDEDAVVWYLEPDWQTILYENELGNLEDIPDMRINGWYDLEDVLKLEVEKRNALMSRKNFVLEWIYNVITSVADPAIEESDGNFLQTMLEAVKQKGEQPK